MRAFLLSMSILFGAPLAVAGGIEAVQLDYVPTDVSLKCDRIFFKSTQHLTGVIYAVPRVIADTDQYNEDVVRLVKNPNETPDKPFMLSFSVYFPRDDEEIKSKKSFDESAKFKACNFEQVKEYLNTVNPKEPVHTVASMPITSFEVSLPDYLSGSKIVGRTAEQGGTDIIDYQGKLYNFSFEVSEKESRGLMDAIQSQEGLQARIRFQFQARRRDGSLSVKIDTSKLAASFEAQAKGKYKIARGQIDASLRMALDSMQLQINTQQGSADFQAIANKIIDKVLAELNLAIKDVVPGDKPEVENSSEEIEVSVVANVIRNKLSQNIEYNNVKEAEAASAESVIQLDSGHLDPRITQVRVSAGEGDATLNKPILAGQTIRIIPAFQALLTIEYKEKTSYLSVEQMRSEAYSEHFQQLFTSGRYSIENETRNGVPVAVIRPYLMFAPVQYFTTEYLWRRVERKPVIVRNPRVTMGNQIEDFERFPITVAFTDVGIQRKRFKFSELLGENAYWKASYDSMTGTIVLTAKQDLGLMVFKERFLMNGKNNDSFAEGSEMDESDFDRDAIVSEALIQQTIESWTDIKDSKPIILRENTKATVKRRVVYFNVLFDDKKSTVSGVANGQ